MGGSEAFFLGRARRFLKHPVWPTAFGVRLGFLLEGALAGTIESARLSGKKVSRFTVESKKSTWLQKEYSLELASVIRMKLIANDLREVFLQEGSGCSIQEHHLRNYAGTCLRFFGTEVQPRSLSLLRIVLFITQSSGPKEVGKTGITNVLLNSKFGCYSCSSNFYIYVLFVVCSVRTYVCTTECLYIVTLYSVLRSVFFYGVLRTVLAEVQGLSSGCLALEGAVTPFLHWNGAPILY